jgi:hypothetical protein
MARALFTAASTCNKTSRVSFRKTLPAGVSRTDFALRSNS